MADELREALGVDPELIPRTNGIFDVIVNDKLLFSKYKEGRFPAPGEVAGKLK